MKISSKNEYTNQKYSNELRIHKISLEVQKKKRKYTWKGLSLQWNTHPRASKCSRRGFDIKDLNDEWSFTFVKPPNASKAAARPVALSPFTCKMVIFCRQLMLDNDKSPTSVMEQYDKLIWKTEKHRLGTISNVITRWRKTDIHMWQVPDEGFGRDKQVEAFQNHWYHSISWCQA